MEKKQKSIKILKAEIKSLAAQSGFLRREERIAYEHMVTARSDDESLAANKNRESIHNYRTHTVREFARAAQLAYAILRQKPYSYVEASSKEPPHFSVLLKTDWILSQFSPGTNYSVRDWVKAEIPKNG